ncbi:lipase family protein [Mariprofundus sp. NF]|nr:lipase family protein [Mariprofundus sp. NF]
MGEKAMNALVPKPLPTDRSFDGLFAANTTYDYFRDCDSHPFRYTSNSYQSVNGWWLAEASLLVYVRDRSFVAEKLKSAGLPHCHFFENRGTQSFVAHNENFAIICFRGTEVSEIEDIVTDLDLPLSAHDGRGLVHRGFKKALDLVWNMTDCDSHNMLNHLNTICSENSGLTLWFTGHSLGAALATLAAERSPKADGLYTFGSPRVGDHDFADNYTTATYRFVNNNDIVTMVPPAISYRHIGQLKYIDDAGLIHDNPNCWLQMKNRITGHVGHLGDLFNSWSHGDLDAIPSDYLNDHAPIYYVVRIWNSYIKDR